MFQLGSMLSTYGCCQYLNRTTSSNNIEDGKRVDAESRIYAASITDISETDRRGMENSVFYVEQDVRKRAGVWGYVFQVIYQTNAGAVMLTDCVFWFIIFPFLLMKDYDLNFILIGMHTVNAIFLLGDTALNSLRFPRFRISYFLFWTSGFVIFQWLLHAFVSIWWPYPFLDLASPQAPMWYLTVALMHIPCYAIFALIIKMKHHILSRWFPQSCLINSRG